ncbi:MAG: EAL domain-containing protein [Bacillaceae bacterium]|nr:EAL domain-containing protein [Bacillaceae bacterium]
MDNEFEKYHHLFNHNHKNDPASGNDPSRIAMRIIENMDEGIMVTNPEGTILSVNPSFTRTTGYEFNEVVGKTPRILQSGKHGLSFYRKMWKSLNQEGSWEGEIWNKRKNGEIYLQWLHINSIKGEDGNTLYYVAFFSDLTSQRNQETELLLATKIIENTIEGVMVTDRHGRILFVNPAFTTVTGYLPDEVIGRNPRLLQSGRHDIRFYKEMWHQILHQGKWEGEIWNKRKNGDVYPEWLNISAVHNPDGEVTHYVAIFNDITVRKQADHQLQSLKYYDALTGLPNRTYFEKMLNRAAEETIKHQKHLAVFYIDLDRFKKINDAFGHTFGDRLLRSVAGRLQACLTEQHMMARLGGDEFTAILTDLDYQSEAFKIADKMISALTRPFFIDQQELFISPSIGISFYSGESDDLERILEHADTAMSRAKQQGGNQYRVYQQDMDTTSYHDVNLETEFRKSLKQNHFYVYYQPKIDLLTGVLIGAEALVRWNHPIHGPVSPQNFIGIAERNGLIGRLDEWVLESACRQARKWLDAGFPPISVSVNLSAIKLEQHNIVETITDVLHRTGLPPEYLDLEITESSIIQNMESATVTLEKLKSLNIKLSLDDFGTGYSSLSYLSRLPIDILKIDQSFVKTLDTNQNNAAIVKAIISMAHSLELKVTAEGVENEKQLAYLREYHCDIGQGYYFDRPSESIEFEKTWLSRGKWA